MVSWRARTLIFRKADSAEMRSPVTPAANDASSLPPPIPSNGRIARPGRIEPAADPSVVAAGGKPAAAEAFTATPDAVVSDPATLAGLSCDAGRIRSHAPAAMSSAAPAAGSTYRLRGRVGASPAATVFEGIACAG